MGVAFVTGLQGDDPRFFKTIATPKHFAVHSRAGERRGNGSMWWRRPHDLEDTYLPAFRAAITEAHAGSYDVRVQRDGWAAGVREHDAADRHSARGVGFQWVCDQRIARRSPMSADRA